MIFLHFAKNFRNEEPEPTVFLRFSNFKYRFSRFFQVKQLFGCSEFKRFIKERFFDIFRPKFYHKIYLQFSML